MILQRKVQFGARTNRHRIFPSINAPFYRDNYDLCLVAEKRWNFMKSFYKPFSEETENRKTLVKKSNFYYFPKTSLLVT